MLEAQKYSAKLVFKGAKEFSSDHLFGLLTEANTAMGLTLLAHNEPGDCLAHCETEAAKVALTCETIGQDCLLSLFLEAASDQYSEDALKAQLAGYLRHILDGLPDATAVEWLDTGARIPRTDFLDALCPAQGTSATQEDADRQNILHSETVQTKNVAHLAPRRIVKAAIRSKRPDAVYHAKLKAVANTAKAHSRNQDQVTATDCVVPVRHQHLTNVLPVIDRHQRPVAANDNPLQPFSAKDAQNSLQEAALRNLLKFEPSEDDLAAAEQERGPIPIEARLSTWAVSLSIATVSLPVAAPVMIYNIARGEDMRVASLAMGLAGFFTALSGSGATAGILPF